MRKIYLEQLKKTEQLIESLPWDNEDFYSNFVAQTYFFVCHSTRLLARSISHFGVDRDHLYRRFVTHIKEENYHEKIAENDLKSLGLCPSDFTEMSITKAFWESQYYKIDQTKGTSLLGYILYLEAIPVHSYKNVLQFLPPKSCQFLKVHMDEDPAHLDHVLKIIQELDSKEQSEIWANYLQTAELYQSMLLQILEKSHFTKNAA